MGKHLIRGEIKRLAKSLVKLLHLLDQKFNPHHDSSGRFAPASGGGASGGTKPVNPKGRDTLEQHTLPDGKLSPERQKLHDAIVAKAFEGKTPVKNPTSYMMGGGPASGKSKALESGLIHMDENSVHIDPDAIKAQLPEYQQMSKVGDKGAAAFSHEESSLIAKRIQGEAAKGGFNSVLDGTGDSSMESLRAKIQKMKASGQKVVANYVTVDTETAVNRSMERAKKTGRFVPESVIRATHRSVSAVVPEAIKEGLFDDFTLWDTGGKLNKVASAKGTSLEIHDQAAWDRFLAKGK